MGSCHHVAHQEGELIFYVPALFAHGLHNGGSGVPLLMSDLLRCVEESKKVSSIYYSGQVSCIFWKNHPIGRVCVLGVVMGVKWKWINNEDYVFLFMDDFSSQTSHKTKTLVCRCLKDVLLGQGVSINSMVGERFRLYGQMNLCYGELQVEVVEQCDSLTDEIDHWQSSLEQIIELNVPWQLDEQVLQDVLTQGSSCGIEYEGVTNFTTPIRLKARRDFIEELQVEKYKEELEIVSPYREISNQEMDSLSGSSLESSARLPFEDSLARKETLLVGTQSSVVDATVEYVVDDQSISVCNENQARAQVLKHLLSCPDRTISIVELYQMSQIYDLISNISAIRFNRQNIMLVKSLEQLKTETFFRLIDYLVTSGLLKYVNRNVIDLMPLKSLYAYCTKRLRALIKMQCYLGTIEVKIIRQKLSLPSLSQKAIIDTFKEALRVAAYGHPNLFTGWWIEINSEKESAIHLEYKKDIIPLKRP